MFSISPSVTISPFNMNWRSSSSSFSPSFSTLFSVLPSFSSKLHSYKGETPNKIETLSKYKFSICFENTSSEPDYISEKIFDCFLLCFMFLLSLSVICNVSTETESKIKRSEGFVFRQRNLSTRIRFECASAISVLYRNCVMRI